MSFADQMVRALGLAPGRRTLSLADTHHVSTWTRVQSPYAESVTYFLPDVWLTDDPADEDLLGIHVTVWDSDEGDQSRAISAVVNDSTGVEHARLDITIPSDQPLKLVKHDDVVTPGGWRELVKNYLYRVHLACPTWHWVTNTTGLSLEKSVEIQLSINHTPFLTEESHLCLYVYDSVNQLSTRACRYLDPHIARRLVGPTAYAAP